MHCSRGPRDQFFHFSPVEGTSQIDVPSSGGRPPLWRLFEDQFSPEVCLANVVPPIRHTFFLETCNLQWVKSVVVFPLCFFPHPSMQLPPLDRPTFEFRVERFIVDLPPVFSLILSCAFLGSCATLWTMVFLVILLTRRPFAVCS